MPAEFQKAKNYTLIGVQKYNLPSREHSHILHRLAKFHFKYGNQLVKCLEEDNLLINLSKF